MYKCRTVSLVIDCMWHIYLSNQIDEIEWTTIVLMVTLGAWRERAVGDGAVKQICEDNVHAKVRGREIEAEYVFFIAEVHKGDNVIISPNSELQMMQIFVCKLFFNSIVNLMAVCNLNKYF